MKTLTKEQEVFLTRVLTDRASDLNEMMCCADTEEMEEYGEEWQEEYDEIQELLIVLIN